MKRKYILLLSLLSCLSFSAMAQGDPDDPEIPVDGGISAVVAAGAIFGISRLKKKN